MSEPLAAPSSLTRELLLVLLVVAGVAAALWTLHRLAFVVLLLVLSGAFAYLIAPLVDIVGRPVHIGRRSRRLPRAAAISIVYLLLAGTVSTGAAILLPRATAQIHDALARAPGHAQSIVTWEQGWTRFYERLRMPAHLRAGIDQSVQSAGEAGIRSARSSAMALAGAISDLPWLILIPILAFFLLKDAAAMRRVVVMALPYGFRLRGHRLFEDLNATLAAYIRAQLLGCALVGGVCGVGFALLGVPYPVLLALLAGAFEFVPLVGPLIVAAVVAVVAALHSPMLALAAIGFLAVLRVVEDYVIYPRLIRRGLELHPLAVIVAVLSGAELDGVAGVFLSVPAVAILSVVFHHWLNWHQRDAAEDAAAGPPGSSSASTSRTAPASGGADTNALPDPI